MVGLNDEYDVYFYYIKLRFFKYFFNIFNLQVIFINKERTRIS